MSLTVQERLYQIISLKYRDDPELCRLTIIEREEMLADIEALVLGYTAEKVSEALAKDAK